MKQFETNVSVVLDFLESESFSASVIRLHKACYRNLAEYLSGNNVKYSNEAVLDWLESHRLQWSYKTYTGYRHCIDQLNDVYVSGEISTDHLSPRHAPYALLSDEFRLVLDKFIFGHARKDDGYRVACSRFLLFLQNEGICDVSAVNYDVVIKFHYCDYHRSWKSKDTYEDLIRIFLRYLADNGLCDAGLSLVLNKLLIHKVIRIPKEELESFCYLNEETYDVTIPLINDFVSNLKEFHYGKTVINSTEHILTLLYVFLRMHRVRMNISLMWYWFDKVMPLLGSNYKQHRRSLYQFGEYLRTGEIITAVTGDPFKTDSIERLPQWVQNPLKDYLALLKREGWQASTVAMHKSSNMRFAHYLDRAEIKTFSDITEEVLKDFNLQDKHSTAEGKAAYNCRIRSFIIYLYEQNLISNPYLYRALPTMASATVPLVETLSDEEVSLIWSVDPDSLNPKALRDYAMVCIGLTMGLRACDIVSLQFENVNWKEKSICITQQKTGKLLIMPMPVKTGNILFRYIRDGRPRSREPYIFLRHEAPYDRVQRGVCRSALKRFLLLPHGNKCKFHVVRKTFATQLLNGNTKVELITDSLGHSTDDTVHKYLSLDESRIRKCAIPMSEVGISYKGGGFHA